MKRTITRIFISLLLGIITTVAVAWVFAAFIRPDIKDSGVYALTPLTGHKTLGWGRNARAGSSITTLSIVGVAMDYQINANEIPNYPEWVSRFIERDIQPAKSQLFSHSYYLRSAGWPAESMWCDDEAASGTTDSLFGGISLFRIKEPESQLARALPYYIIPSGFVIDTALYAAIWFVLLIGLSFTRSKWRIRHNHCPVCGYDLRGRSLDTAAGTACPECGAAT